MQNRVLVLHSGGLDSTVCLLQALSERYEVISLGINYGQTHIIEHEYAMKQCEKYNVERKIININWDKPKRDIPLDRDLQKIKEGVSPAFLPGRNAIFLNLAFAEAIGLNCKEVWIGINSLDFSGYTDCTPEFVHAFEELAKLAFDKPPKLKAPLQNLSKPQIAELAYKLGIRKGDTWSCYRPKLEGDILIPCERCDACVLHNYAWKNANLKTN